MWVAVYREPLKAHRRMYTDTAWVKDAERELQSASHAVVASYIFNNEAILAQLQKKLRGRGAFTCLVLVDDAAHEANAKEKRVLKELRRDGAQVCLCTGRNRGGIFHWKALILDSRVAYWGTANLTMNTLNSRDVMQRLTGPAVDDLKAGVAEAMQNGKVLA
jgi:hypothetical protein